MSAMTAGDDAGKPVALSVEDGIARITLSDPQRRNVLSVPLCKALISAVEDANARDDVKVLLVTGAGTTFCAGAELSSLLSASNGDTEEVQLVYAAFGALADSGKLTVAAVNGPAVGAGMNLALACDVRIAAQSAKFDCRFLALGIHQGGGHAWMLNRVVGAQTAAAMLLFGQQVDGPQAKRVGLVWEIVEDGELLPRALDFSKRAAAASNALLKAMKNTLLVSEWLPTRAEAMALETERQLESLSRPAAKQAIQAMYEKISSAKR